ncbi:hypothetical protein MP638_001471 [Amoeboaphelidium occidentale]|nr:hypothetical protein MP638_001471 [Amoeboaphelidium occidentale]
MGKNTDKLYITHSEWQNDFSGKKSNSTRKKSSENNMKTKGKLCCSLSKLNLSEILSSNAEDRIVLCRRSGLLYSLLHFLSFFKKYHCDPFSGTFQSLEDELILVKNSEYCAASKEELYSTDDIVVVVVVDVSEDVSIMKGLKLRSGYAYLKSVFMDSEYDLVTGQLIANPKEDVIKVKTDKDLLLKKGHQYELLPSLSAYFDSTSAAATTTTTTTTSTTSKASIPRKLAAAIANQNEMSLVGKNREIFAQSSVAKSKVEDSSALTCTIVKPLSSAGVGTLSKRKQELIFNKMFYRELRESKKKGLVRFKINDNTEGFHLDLELYCYLCPVTCHNFIMLCRNGFYEKSSFHRLVPGFVLQGGGGSKIEDDVLESRAFFQSDSGYLVDGMEMSLDINNNNDGDDNDDQKSSSVDGMLGLYEKFGYVDGGCVLNYHADEIDLSFMQLKHSQRGTLSMANLGKRGTNGSQFFLTLRDDCNTQLDGKYTVFGKLLKPSLSVLNSIEQIGANEKTEKPLKDLEITRVEILKDPYRELFEKRLKVADTENRDKKRKLEKILQESDEIGKYIKAPVERQQPPIVAAAVFAQKKTKLKQKGQFGDFSSW